MVEVVATVLDVVVCWGAVVVEDESAVSTEDTVDGDPAPPLSQAARSTNAAIQDRRTTPAMLPKGQTKMIWAPSEISMKSAAEMMPSTRS